MPETIKLRDILIFTDFLFKECDILNLFRSMVSFFCLPFFCFYLLEFVVFVMRILFQVCDEVFQLPSFLILHWICL